MDQNLQDYHKILDMVLGFFDTFASSYQGVTADTKQTRFHTT